MDLQTFLTRFGEPLAQRVTEAFDILHDPVRDAGQTPALDAKLAQLKRPCFPAQGEAAKAIARAFYEHGERSAIVSGEMGTGKTCVALSVMALAPRPLRALVLCPPHLVNKWEREAQTVLPDVRTVPIGGSDCLPRLCKLKAAVRHQGRRPLERPELWILGRERAKLHHRWIPAYMSRQRGTIVRVSDGQGGESRHLETTREPLCVRCGMALKDKEQGVTLPLDALTRQHIKCLNCDEPAYCADNTGPRRYSPAMYIKRHLPGVFDLLIADELHELKGESTGQGNAFGALAAAIPHVVSLTGTLTGGYADNLFYICFRQMAPELVREGFAYHKVSAWMERFGVLEKVIRLSKNEDYEDARTVRGRTKKTTMRRRPGISPLVLGKHLLPHTAFLRLADVADTLPPYEERVVTLAMSPDLEAAYTGLEGELLLAVKNALAQGSQHLLSAYLQSLLCYPDQAAFRPERILDPRTEEVVATAPVVPGPLPKEEELVELCLAQHAKGRRVLVYTTFTDTRDLTPRIKSLLDGAGLRTAVLKNVPPQQREDWIAKRVTDGIDVLIANPELVKTGLDLYAFPCFIFLMPGYSVYTLRQASRRAWRIGQTEPCEVIYLAYAKTMQTKALTLIATKLEAALALEGELSDSGLSALSEQGDSLILELARALVNHVGEKESVEAVWARLRRKDMEHLLTLTATKPSPAVEVISEAIQKIEDRVIIVDLMEAHAPRPKRVGQLEVKVADIDRLLAERPHLAQLALF